MFEREGDQTVSYEGLEIHAASITTIKEVVCSLFSRCFHDYSKAFMK